MTWYPAAARAGIGTIVVVLVALYLGVDPGVMEAMLPYFTEIYGNAASINHRFGWDASDAVETARGHIAKLLNTDPRNIIFTSGATESNNLAIHSLAQIAAGKSPRVLVSPMEHPSSLEPTMKFGMLGYGKFPYKYASGREGDMPLTGVSRRTASSMEFGRRVRSASTLASSAGSPASAGSSPARRWRRRSTI